MRDAVEIIYRPVDRIDHPLVIALLIADDSFLAVKRMLREISSRKSSVISSCDRTSISSLMSCASAELTRSGC